MVKQDQIDIFDELAKLDGLDKEQLKKVANERFEISKSKIGEESE